MTKRVASFYTSFAAIAVLCAAPWVGANEQEKRMGQNTGKLDGEVYDSRPQTNEYYSQLGSDEQRSGINSSSSTSSTSMGSSSSPEDTSMSSDMSSDTSSSDQQAGSFSEDQPVIQPSQDDQAGSASTSGSVPPAPSSASGSNNPEDAQKMAMKQSVAPHTIMIQTALTSALDQVKGMKAQLKVAENQQPGKQTIEHVRMMGKEFNNDLKTATTHQSHLQKSSQRFPELKSKSEFQSFNTALSDMKSFTSSWSTKQNNSSYWQNREQAMADLNNLESRLTKAVDTARSFNSSEFDVSIG